MGMRIDTYASALTSADASRATSAQRPVERDPAEDRGSGLPQDREETFEFRAGWGKDTLSPNGAALVVLGRNIESARRVVPTVEELRDQLRETRAEQRAAQEEAVGRREEAARQVESFRPEPTPRARSFVQDTEQTQARFEAPPPAEALVEAPEPADLAPSAYPPPAAAQERFDVLV